MRSSLGTEFGFARGDRGDSSQGVQTPIRADDPRGYHFVDREGEEVSQLPLSEGARPAHVEVHRYLMQSANVALVMVENQYISDAAGLETER